MLNSPLKMIVPWNKRKSWQNRPYWSYQQIDMVTLYEEHTGNRLKKSGRAYTGKCPFHDDNTPSLAIYTDTKSFYCFGCEEGGGAFKFQKLIKQI